MAQHLISQSKDQYASMENLACISLSYTISCFVSLYTEQHSHHTSCTSAVKNADVWSCIYIVIVGWAVCVLVQQLTCVTGAIICSQKHNLQTRLCKSMLDPPNTPLPQPVTSSIIYTFVIPGSACPHTHCQLHTHVIKYVLYWMQCVIIRLGTQVRCNSLGSVTYSTPE